MKKYSAQWQQTDSITNENLKKLSELSDVKFIEPEKIHGKLFHHRRTLDDSELLFLVNTSLEEWSAGTFVMKGKSVDELNLFNGEITEGGKWIKNFRVPQEEMPVWVKYGATIPFHLDKVSCTDEMDLNKSDEIMIDENFIGIFKYLEAKN